MSYPKLCPFSSDYPSNALFSYKLVTNEETNPDEEDEELARSEAIYADTIAQLQTAGMTIPDRILHPPDWVTVKCYAERHALTEALVLDWIARGVIPADCVEILAEFNNLTLVIDQPYQDKSI